MDRLLDWFDRQSQKKVDFPATILGQKVNTPEDGNTIIVALPLWTYRGEFTVPLPMSNLMTDKNWGCLIRTSQMLLSRALILHGCYAPEDFRDVPEAPFSIHAMCHAVAEPHREFEAKFWAPSQGCEAIRRTVSRAKLRVPLTVLVCDCGTIYNDELIFALKRSPILLLLPVRPTAGERITQEVFQVMEFLLGLSQCVGIVGGVPRRSYYFIGTTDTTQRLIFLDPHVRTQPAFVEPKDIGHHCEGAESVSSVDWKRIDPSLLIGIYLASAADLQAFTSKVEDFRKFSEALFIHFEATRLSICGRRKVSLDDVTTF